MKLQGIIKRRNAVPVYMSYFEKLGCFSPIIKGCHAAAFIMQ
jgi:hypothetical protein